jgi:hypothetical protein
MNSPETLSFFLSVGGGVADAPVWRAHRWPTELMFMII